MLNLMLPGIAPRKAGAKLLLFYKSTKFLHDFYQIILIFLRFHTLLILKNIHFHGYTPFNHQQQEHKVLVLCLKDWSTPTKGL